MSAKQRGALIMFLTAAVLVLSPMVVVPKWVYVLQMIVFGIMFVFSEGKKT